MQNITKNTGYLFLGFITAIIFVILADFIIINKQIIYTQLHNWKIIPYPETLTELYFENHLKLAQYLDNSKPYSFSFTIHNLEYKYMTYHYQVIISNTEGHKSWDEGYLSMSHGEKKTITENIVDKTLNSRTKVVVKLVEQKQQIHFWMDLWVTPMLEADK